MDENLKLLKKFEEVNNKIKDLINRFPSQKREEILFGKWSLKEVVAHLNSLMKYDIDSLINLKRGKKTFWEPDVDIFNERGVSLRNDKRWSEVYQEFMTLRDELINTYRNLSNDLFKADIWVNHDGTPLRSLKVDIKHWEGEHIPELKRVLSNI